MIILRRQKKVSLKMIFLLFDVNFQKSLKKKGREVSFEVDNWGGGFNCYKLSVRVSNSFTFVTMII